MRAFTALYHAIDGTQSTLEKRAAMVNYFRQASTNDAAWALYFLSGGKLAKSPRREQLKLATEQWLQLPRWILDACRDHTGDFAETLALLADNAVEKLGVGSEASSLVADLGLAELVETRLIPLPKMRDDDQRAALVALWATCALDVRLVLNKLMTGALRIGVSKRSAQQAVAEAFRLPQATIVQRMMGEWRPTPDNFQRLISEQSLPEDALQPYPFFLASGLAGPVEALGSISDWLLEWKWDGIRLQLIKRRGQLALWSRGEERLDGRYPEIETAAARLPDNCVLDGELLAVSNGIVQPFSLLQKRINRLKPSKRLQEQVPLVFMAYDLLESDGQDRHDLPLIERREKLETLVTAELSPAIALSTIETPANWSDAAELRQQSRERKVEGFMLKRKSSAYQIGRRRGDWWKWKIEPLHVDAVLMYAQPGSGRRATLLTDYTFGLWKNDALIPVAKAYSGLDQQEIEALDAWVRKHTVQRFGPVRAVEAEQVFELAFEGVALSSRHKSGVATRFPRISRWRTDKSVEQADQLATLLAMAMINE